MRIHVYQFEGKAYVQKEGGSIGMAATGVIARLRMMRWARKFRELSKKNRLELLVFKIYVDDENQVWRVFEKGRRWNKDHMEWREEWELEDLEKGEADDKRMMREILAMANTIEKDIRLTADMPSTNPDQKLPVLDVKMWVEERQTEQGVEYS